MVGGGKKGGKAEEWGGESEQKEGGKIEKKKTRARTRTKNEGWQWRQMGGRETRKREEEERKRRMKKGNQVKRGSAKKRIVWGGVLTLVATTRTARVRVEAG